MEVSSIREKACSIWHSSDADSIFFLSFKIPLSALQTADEGGLYAKQLAIARVQSRWPPRVTAALSAFITVQNKGMHRFQKLFLCRSSLKL